MSLLFRTLSPSFSSPSLTERVFRNGRQCWTEALADSSFVVAVAEDSVVSVVSVANRLEADGKMCLDSVAVVFEKDPVDGCGGG